MDIQWKVLAILRSLLSSTHIKMRIKNILFSLPFLVITQPCFTQETDLGSWNIINVKYNVDKKWSLFAEAQLRSLKFYDYFHYHEFKGGFNYQVHPNLSLTLAAGKYDTYKEGGNFVSPKNNDEFRIWPQITLSQAIGSVKIEQRYRAEFRFTSNGYRNRFRYRLGLSKPFGNDKLGYKPFQININSEIFFTDNEPYFERNRTQLSISYKMSKQVAFQLGFLYQFDYKINDETGRNFLVTGLFVELFKNN
jgi:Protein of unknown function (DUF2490)